ncbi:hypothetical protein E2C01_045982 [Portunus trituberculatus]|uniref:Uncharacterized protein n=1 Tax=Portunus trituberculatus TaxID=210409 RepID=A0A5B7FX79_PORTR|nr:hypothetical protein [Portunus trituberculatus]
MSHLAVTNHQYLTCGQGILCPLYLVTSCLLSLLLHTLQHSEGICRFHSLRRPEDLSPFHTSSHHSPLLLAVFHYLVRRLQEPPLPQALSSSDGTQPAGQRITLKTPPAPPRSFDGTQPPPLIPL